jgi:universal stress protein A
MMLPIHKILCPLDFSDYSVRALKAATELAGIFNAQIITHHVITDIPSIGTAYGVVNYSPKTINMQKFMEEMEKTSFQELNRLVQQFGSQKIVYDKKVTIGIPADEIVQLAETEHVDLIVLTTHGRTGLSRVFMGSVAEGVIRHAPCPVLSLRIRKED